VLTSQDSLTPELCVEDGPGECQWLAPFVTANDLGGTGPFYQRVTIRTLTDDALLGIFDAYVDEAKRIDACIRKTSKYLFHLIVLTQLKTT
jgi:hypothetical protein